MRHLLTGLWALAIAACTAVRPSAAVEDAADLILAAQRVHTLDPSNPIAEAIVVADGRVVAVGGRALIAAHRGPSTEVIDLGDAVVVPGLVDAHLHLAEIGRAAGRLDLRGADLPELLAEVRTAAEITPQGRPILGRGWDQNRWSRTSCPAEPTECLDANGFPDRALLDAVAPRHPVVLERIDGHAAWVNSSALELARVDERSPEPKGGRVHRRPDGSPTGVLIDNAMSLVIDRLPVPTPAEVQGALLAAQSRLLALGLTGAHDMGSSPVDIEALKRLDSEGRLKLRVFAYRWGNEGDLASIVASGPHRGRRLEVRGVKLMIDGALGSRGAALMTPYTDADHAGALLMSEQQLQRRVEITRQAGLQPAIHAIGDRANRVVLDVFARVFGEALAAARPRLEHAQVLSRPDIGRVARLGVVASMQPTHATSDMPWAETRVGRDRIRGAYAWRSLRVAGATIAAGSDAPVELPDPRLGLFAARTRPDARGAPAAALLKAKIRLTVVGGEVADRGDGPRPD